MLNSNFVSSCCCTTVCAWCWRKLNHYLWTQALVRVLSHYLWEPLSPRPVTIGDVASRQMPSVYSFAPLAALRDFLERRIEKFTRGSPSVKSFLDQDFRLFLGEKYSNNPRVCAGFTLATSRARRIFFIVSAWTYAPWVCSQSQRGYLETLHRFVMVLSVERQCFLGFQVLVRKFDLYSSMMATGCIAKDANEDFQTPCP